MTINNQYIHTSTAYDNTYSQYFTIQNHNGHRQSTKIQYNNMQHTGKYNKSMLCYKSIHISILVPGYVGHRVCASANTNEASKYQVQCN